MDQIKIDIPKDYMIDTENSDFDKGLIKIKRKYQDYNDILKGIKDRKYPDPIINTLDEDKIIAISKIINTARILNEGWEPDWTNGEIKYHINVDKGNKVVIHNSYYISHSFVYFKSEELAQQAIDILGKEIFLNAFK